MRKIILSLTLIIALTFGLTGCALFESEVNDIQGSITGNTYNADFYSNTGEKFMTVKGSRINMAANVVREPYYGSNGWGYTQTMSSVVTITIDSHQIENCGSTVIFMQDSLKPEADFTEIDSIESESDGSVSNMTLVAGLVNQYKNAFGKPQIVVIQSQLGNPICAFSGDDVYWKVCEDLPKTTKLMIDGKALYIHRANFQIIDKELL